MTLGDELDQITARIAELESTHDKVKRLNEWWRKHNTTKGFPGISDAAAERMPLCQTIR